MYSRISHSIRNRETPNNIFITPPALAKTNIDMISCKETDIWLDPFKNSGNYFNQFPTEKKDWCEILDGKDFFEYDKPVDIICSNPPYSMMNAVLEKSVKLNPRVISYLIGVGNLTSKRIEDMEKNGYKIVKLHLCKVYKWYGMSFIVVWEKTEQNGILSYDRTTWK